MQRATVMLPPSLELEAQKLAREQGVSLGELVREGLATVLERERRNGGRDPLFADQEVWSGEVPRDLSVNVDVYLYPPSSRWTVAGEKASRQTATYSAPSPPGLE